MTAPKAKPVRPRVPVGQLILAAILLISVELWCAAHLGASAIDTAKNLPIVAPAAVILGLVPFFGKTADQSLKARVQSIVRGILSYRVLIPLAVAFSLILLFFSSIKISGATTAVQLRRSSDGGLVWEGKPDGAQKQLASIVRTSPAGRAYSLRVQGYVPANVTIFPVVPLEIQADRLVPETTLFLRLPPSAPVKATDTIKILAHGNPPLTLVEETPLQRRLGILVGPPRSTDSLREKWRLEAAGRGEDEARFAPYLNSLKDPLVLTGNFAVAPGTRLSAVVKLNNKPATNEFTVTGELVYDMLLTNFNR